MYESRSESIKLKPIKSILSRSQKLLYEIKVSYDNYKNNSWDWRIIY